MGKESSPAVPERIAFIGIVRWIRFRLTIGTTTTRAEDPCTVQTDITSVVTPCRLVLYLRAWSSRQPPEPHRSFSSWFLLKF